MVTGFWLALLVSSSSSYHRRNIPGVISIQIILPLLTSKNTNSSSFVLISQFTKCHLFLSIPCLKENSAENTKNKKNQVPPCALQFEGKCTHSQFRIQTLVHSRLQCVSTNKMLSWFYTYQIKNIYIIIVFYHALFLLADIWERGIAKQIQATYQRE